MIFGIFSLSRCRVAIPDFGSEIPLGAERKETKGVGIRPEDTPGGDRPGRPRGIGDPLRYAG
jgi:hypothetical protein